MRLTCQGERVDVLAIICACHVLLTQTDGIFSFGDAIEDFELLLRDALEWQEAKLRTSGSAKVGLSSDTYPPREIHLHSKDSDILGALVLVVDGGCSDGHDVECVDEKDDE